jgi:hypothetical protein
VAWERVKQLKDVTLEYEAASAVSLKVYTDMPGSAVALRATLTFPATSGRQTKTLPLDGHEGTLIKWEATSAGVFRLYGGSFRARPVGTYIDGSVGEKWMTQEMSIGL